MVAGKRDYLKRGRATTIQSMRGTTATWTDWVSGTEIINSVHFLKWELKGGTFVTS